MKKRLKHGSKASIKNAAAAAVKVKKQPGGGTPSKSRKAAPTAIAAGLELSAPPPSAKKPPKRPTNLTLDPDALARAERFGREHGASVSQLVNGFLHSLPTREPSSRPADLSPTVRRLYGVAAGGDAAQAGRSSERGADREAYRAHLEEKYVGRA